MSNMFEVNASVFERSSDKFLCENNDFNSNIYTYNVKDTIRMFEALYLLKFKFTSISVCNKHIIDRQFRGQLFFPFLPI